MFFRRRKMFTIVIIALVSLTMLGSGFVALFSIPEQGVDPDSERKLLEDEYAQRRQLAASLSQSAENDPENSALREALADAWLDVYILASYLGAQETDGALGKALDLYAELTAAGPDSAIQLKYATAAFYDRDFTLTGELLTDLLAREPENIDALTVYGQYLFYGAADYALAEQVWQEALSLARDDTERSSIEYYISLAQTAKNAAAESAATENEDG
ncbi:MAG: hypothetical protein LBL37_04825 [Gracilibacteraceae bacterium]|jgi:cytochrome c-type biogenesis protein CcmH/NrfG|nr:hypothetical protein [Gracilibacteraceae bacterium]